MKRRMESKTKAMIVWKGSEGNRWPNCVSSTRSARPSITSGGESNAGHEFRITPSSGRRYVIGTTR